MSRLLTTASTALLLAALSLTAWAAPDAAHHGRGTSGIFWFLHVSDSHIGASQLVYPNASDHFEVALGEAVPVIAPAFVACTGDLVDGSANNIPTSGQEQAEWDAYRQIVDQAGMSTTFFFDPPGNHDGYNDPGMTFYLANSLQGQANGRLFHEWVVDTPVGEHYFFGLNSAGDGSGPALEDPEFTADEIAALDAGLEAHASAELVFTLSHHPLGQPTNGGQVIDLLASSGGAYHLHGHRHDYTEYLEGSNSVVVNEVDTLGKGNIDNIGVGVVDHAGFAYRARDVVSPWPFVLISTPLGRTLRGSDTPHPYAYDVCLDRPDNPFRAVVFAPEAPADVTLAVGTLAPSPMGLVAGSGSLWQAEIDTSTLAPGPHDVTVTALVGGDVGQHTVSTVFVPGPCPELPDSDVPVGGGGAGGGTAGTGGLGGTGGAGAVGGEGGGAGSPGAAPLDEEGGCACRLRGQAVRGGGGLPLVALGLLTLLAAARRRRARPSR